MRGVTGSEQHAAGGSLAGVRVLELGVLIASPFAGRVLADHGADVVKIEAPDRPDPLRGWGQAERDGHHVFWTTQARGKRCITLDLRTPAGQDVFRALAATADVVCENFRPGTLERWGIGPDVLLAANPRLVVCRVSGYGQTGPESQQPGYASVAEARSGMRHLTGHPGEPPVRTSLSLGDTLGGLFAVQGILLALVHRARTGRGQVVDVALTESCLAMTESLVADFSLTGHVRQPSGTRLDGIAPSNLYPTADGQWVIVAANQDTLFGRLAVAMGDPATAADPRFATHDARGAHQDELDALIAGWTRVRTAVEVIATLRSAGVVVGPVSTAADVAADPQFLARGALVAHHDERLDDDVLGPGVAPLLSDSPGAVRWAGPPRPGSHNAEVYAELLGYGPGRLADLDAEGTV